MAFLRNSMVPEDWEDPEDSYIPPPSGQHPPHGGPAQPPVPGPDPTPEGGGVGGGGVPPPFPGSSSPGYNFKPVPRFTPPAFRRPSFDDALNEPGYQFRLGGGASALERSAAARGTLRTGGTLKDIMEYGQNFAAQEYGNVFNRALNVYDREYQGAKDQFAPKYGEWQFLSGAEKARALAAFQREWDMYSFGNMSAAQKEAIIASILNG